MNEYTKDTNFKDLPRQGKIVAIHTLNKDLGATALEIAKITGLSGSNVYRYLSQYEMPATNEWDGFKKAIKEMFTAKVMTLEAKAYQALEERMPEAKYFELVGLMKTINDAKREDRKAESVNIKDSNIVFDFKKD